MTKLELENCIAQYGRDIYSFCRFLTRDGMEADELYQDTFLRAVEHMERMEIKENPKGYLLAVALRLWKDRQRKTARRQRIAPSRAYVEGWEEEDGEGAADHMLAEGEAIPENRMLQEETRGRVRQAVQSLTEKYRIVVVLFYMEELNLDQIAEVLKLPVGTVKSRLFHARKQLKKKLEDVYDG